MKKITSIIAVVLVLTSVLGGCKKTTTTPSPNVPVVSESPAITSPKVSASPSASPKASPVTSPKASAPASPGQKQPATSPSASPKA